MEKEFRTTADFQSLYPWEEPEKAFELISLLERYDDVGLSAERYGPSDVRTFDLKTLENSEIERTWVKVSGGNFKRKNPWNFHISVFYLRHFKRRVSSDLWIWVDREFFQDENRTARFLDLCRNIYAWGEMDHGHITLPEEYAKKNEFGPGSGVGGPNLTVSLPGIYWANFFGPRYVEWLGPQKFESLSTHYKEKLNDGGWLLVTRPNLLEYNGMKIRAHEKYIIKKLGRKAFFEMSNPGKKTIVPNFWGPIEETE